MRLTFFAVSVTSKEEDTLLHLMKAVTSDYIEKKERAQQNEMQNKLNTISEKHALYSYFVFQFFLEE